MFPKRFAARTTIVALKCSKPLHVLGGEAGTCSGEREGLERRKKEVRKSWRRLWFEKRKRSGGGFRLFRGRTWWNVVKHVQARWLIAGSEIELA